MKHFPNASEYTQLLVLRCQLIEAFLQNRTEQIFRLSREIDEMQLRHWQRFPEKSAS